jgi:hypothetical protein
MPCSSVAAAVYVNKNQRHSGASKYNINNRSGPYLRVLIKLISGYVIDREDELDVVFLGFFN